jgi:hypothetical protein
MFEITVGVVAGFVAAGFFFGMILFRTLDFCKYLCGLSYVLFLTVQDVRDIYR